MNIRLALLRDRERVDAGKDAPKCVGASLSLRMRALRERVAQNALELH